MSILASILPALISGGMSLFKGRGGGGQQQAPYQPVSQMGGGLLTRPGEERQFERFTPEQQQLTEMLRNILTGQGDQPTGGLLGSIFGQEGFDAYAQPEMRAYQEEIVPGLAERFTALGGQRSSGFQQALARSGENLATRLGQMRSQQQQSLLGGLLGQVMQPQFHTQYTPGGPTGLASLLGSIGGGIGRGATTALGGFLS